MTFILQTERLILRKFITDDAEDMYDLNNDPEVMKHTGDISFKSIEDARKLIINYSDYNNIGFGRWSVLLKEGNTFIGWCGLKKHPEGFVDLGFRFHKKYWNKGYATESAIASLEYGFNNLNLVEIVGRSASENIASRRVLEKLNMKFIKFEACEGIDNSTLYKITREQFENTL